MNIRKVIECLRDVAQNLPDGLDSDVRVHICNGDHAGMMIRAIQVDTMATLDTNTGGVLDSYAIVQGHPHLDENAGETMRPLTMDVDAQVEKWATDGVGEAPHEPAAGGLPDIDYTADPDSGTRYILLRASGMMYVQTELDESGVIRYLPGSAEAVAAGCLCDPARNNHGAGTTTPGERQVFVYRRDCPLHRHVRWPR